MSPFSDEDIPEIRPADFQEKFLAVKRELAKVIVGQDRVIEHLLVAVLAGGHVLLTGLPGLGRTLLVKTLAKVLGLTYRRLQFTPDLLPTDIIGAEILEHSQLTGERRFRFFKGPVFANMLLVDEINRSPSRTQSALLEVMQERQVTAGGQTHFLPRPFVLIATENSLDTEGVWSLGEAQVDRFMMSIEQSYPSDAEERRMIHLTTGSERAKPSTVASPEEVLSMQALVREVPVVPSVRDFALGIVRGSRPGEIGAVKQADAAVRLGASPRAAQALLLGGKVIALARGRTHVTRDDISNIVRPCMVHRLLMDFKAAAEGSGVDDLLDALIQDAYERSLPRVSRWTRQLLKPLKAR